jgi:hypothetical protein
MQTIWSYIHTIERDRVGCGPQAVEAIMSIVIRLEFATEIMFHLIVVLLLVQPIRRRLPHIDPSTGYWFLRDRVKYLAMHVRDLSVVDTMYDCGFVLEYRSIVPEEGAENGTCSCCVRCLCRSFECDFIDEPGEGQPSCSRLKWVRLNSRLKPDDIAHELTLIPLIVTHLPCPIDHLHPRHPLVNRKLVLPGKIMDMSDQTAHDLPHPRGRLWAHSLDDMLCEGRIESRVNRHISTAVRRGHLVLLYR